MKKSILFIIIIFTFSACKQQIDWRTLIQGVYSMEEQSISQNGKTNTLKDLNQLKIYTPDHFMFTQLNSQGAASFGVGSFTAKGDTIVEHSIYTAQGKKEDKSINDFALAMSTTPKGYKQVINGILINGVPSVLTEFYSRTGNDSLKTPLDGVWHETKSYQVRGKDTVLNNRIQYKAFFKGQFMFGNFSNPDTDSSMTGMGYGTFKMISDGKIEETDLVSSFGTIAGFTFPVDYSVTDNDHFVQTVHNQDGTIGVEFYERLK